MDFCGSLVSTKASQIYICCCCSQRHPPSSVTQFALAMHSQHTPPRAKAYTPAALSYIPITSSSPVAASMAMITKKELCGLLTNGGGLGFSFVLCGAQSKSHNCRTWCVCQSSQEKRSGLSFFGLIIPVPLTKLSKQQHNPSK